MLCESDLELQILVRSKKTDLVRANRNRLLVRNRMRTWCSGHVFVYSCDSALTSLDSENSRQRRLLPCQAPRRDAPSALRSAPDPSIRACVDGLQSGGEETCRDASQFFQPRIRALHDDRLLLAAYSRMIRSHERRALGALLSFISWSVSASPNNQPVRGEAL